MKYTGEYWMVGTVSKMRGNRVNIQDAVDLKVFVQKSKVRSKRNTTVYCSLVAWPMSVNLKVTGSVPAMLELDFSQWKTLHGYRSKFCSITFMFFSVV